jgi:hypothetical protein
VGPNLPRVSGQDSAALSARILAFCRSGVAPPQHRTSRGSLGRVDDEPLICAECGRGSRDDKNAAEEWRAYLDINDDLPVFCPECAEREFVSGGAPD